MSRLYDNQRLSGNAVFGLQTFAAASPPTGAITSQTIDGQNVTISGATTNTPTSGLCTLTANGGGAVTQGPTAVTLGSGTFTIAFTGVPAGDYLAPTVTLTNAGGTASATGGSAFSIVGVGGSPEAPASTTPVSSDLAASYAIQGLVSADLTASYVVRESVSADLAATYSVASSTSLVSADLVASYNIESPITLVSADLEAAYAVKEFVSSSLEAAYAINARVSADLEAAYAIFEAPSTSLVGADLEVSYRVFAYVHADLDVSFVVVTKLPKIPANSPRKRLLTSHPGMNFSPKRQAEIEIFGYDFADILPDGVTIDSVMWSSEVYEGADASANAMIVSPATIDGTQVRVLIGNGVRGATYIPTCTIRASSGEVKVLPPQGSGLLRIT